MLTVGERLHIARTRADVGVGEMAIHLNRHRNRVTAYENAGDREKKRAAMQADPDWRAYIAESGKLGALDRQENWLYNDVSFYPFKR